MEVLKLVRKDSSDTRIFGEIFFDGLRVVDTLELPWKDNKPFYSAIPEGQYHFKYEEHHKFGKCFLLFDIPGRDRIFIHPANEVKELQGCIAVGFRIGEFLKDSRECLDTLTDMAKEGTLIIESEHE